MRKSWIQCCRSENLSKPWARQAQNPATALATKDDADLTICSNWITNSMVAILAWTGAGGGRAYELKATAHCALTSGWLLWNSTPQVCSAHAKAALTLMGMERPLARCSLTWKAQIMGVNVSMLNPKLAI